jgi:hypothetical protein
MQAGRVDQGVDQSDAAGLFGIGVLPREHQREGLLDADEAGQVLRSAPAGQEPELDFGEREGGLVRRRGDPVVAPEGQFQAPTGTGSVNRRHRGNGEVLQP